MEELDSEWPDPDGGKGKVPYFDIDLNGHARYIGAYAGYALRRYALRCQRRV